MKRIHQSVFTRRTIAALTLSALVTAPLAVNNQVAIAAPAKKAPAKSKPKRADGLIIQDYKVGRGALATAGKTVTVHYRGVLTNGREFDQSYKRGTPFTFSLGAGQVIPGWDRGVAGMRVGGKRRLTIPPALGYGAAGSPPVIPPNSTLIFVVELLKVQG